MDTCVSQLGYVGLEVSDVEAWDGFATDILGLERNGAGADGERCFRMDENHHRMLLHPGDRDDLAYAGWEAADAASLEAIAERLESLGVQVTWATPEEARRRRVERLFTVLDPSGVKTEVYCGAQKAERPFQSPRGIGGFETGRLGMGHIVLCVDDYEASLRFYCEGLGLKTSDYIDLDMGADGVTTVAFLHAGPRHHSLAIVPVEAPRRLHHVMLQVKEMDDVGTTYDLCQDREVPIATSLGCHTNDRMVSFYMQSPSGFQIEYGFGGVEIDDDHWEVAHYDAPSIWGHRHAG